MAAADSTNNKEQQQRSISNLSQHQQKNKFCDFTLTINIKSNQIKSNQIKIFISINNDDNNRYSTYKGNIVMCINVHLHTFKYIYTHTYY